MKKENERVRLDVGNYLAPLPVTLISSGIEHKQANLMTVAWNGIINSEPPMLSVSIRKERYSHATIKKSGELVVNLVGEDLARAVDYCGVKSYRDVDKFKELALTPEILPELRHAPALRESPLSLGCQLRQIIELPTHDLFLAEIVAVRVQAELLDKKGSLCLERAKLLNYVHGQYYGLGKWLGFFGWSVARKEVFRAREKAMRNR